MYTSARYVCEACGFAMDDAQKFASIRRGEWRPTNPNAFPGERSYQLASIYSPDRKCTLGALAVKFLQAKDSLGGLQSFINGDLAEPWEDQEFSPERKRTELISTGEVPVPGGIRLMTVDVQAVSPMFWSVVREWGESGDSRLVFAGHCDAWEDVARIQESHEVESHRVIVDSGFNGQEVYQRCLGRSKLVNRSNGPPVVVGWLPAKSREGRLVWNGKDGRRPTPYFLGRAALPPQMRIELPLAEFDADALRDILAKLRKGEDGSPKWEIIPMPAGCENVGVRRVPEDEYFLHLDAWKRRARADARRGKVVIEWAARTRKAADHLLDCELMQVLGAMIHRRLKTSMPAPAQEPEQGLSLAPASAVSGAAS
jgi:hypothetical protein